MCFVIYTFQEREREKESKRERERKRLWGPGHLFCSPVTATAFLLPVTLLTHTCHGTFTHICKVLFQFIQIFSLLLKLNHQREPIHAFQKCDDEQRGQRGPGGARLNLASGIPRARGHGWSHGAVDLKVGAPQGVSVAPRHGHHNSKRGGNKSELRTQRLLDTSGEIRWPAHWWSTTSAQLQTTHTPPLSAPLNDLIPYITIHPHNSLTLSILLGQMKL